ncbi:MAG TPA: hypothetical protein PKC21_02865 [Oligoflexia bacterium]|nr:hypothetical protein [Oligoflexia bacterium]
MKQYFGFYIFILSLSFIYAQNNYFEIAEQSLLRAKYTALSNAEESSEVEEERIDWDYFQTNPNYLGIWGLMAVYVYDNEKLSFYDAEHIRTDLNISQLFEKKYETSDDRSNLEIRLDDTFLQTRTRRRVNITHRNGFQVAHSMLLVKIRSVFGLILNQLDLDVPKNMTIMCGLSVHHTMVCMHEEYIQGQPLSKKIVMFMYKEESF